MKALARLLSSGDNGTSFINMPVVVGKRPVNNAARAGVQTGEVLMELVKFIDSVAS